MVISAGLTVGASITNFSMASDRLGSSRIDGFRRVTRSRMTAKKVTVEDAKNIIKTLYPAASRASRGAVSGLHSKVIQNNIDSLQSQPKNTKRHFQPLEVDDILKYESKEPKKHLREARPLLPTSDSSTYSNVLHFRTRNQLLHTSDFIKMAPQESSLFDWKSFPEQKYTMTVVQSRTPDLLLPRGGFYLIFKTPDEAAAYMVDTLGKQINGVNFYLEMVDPDNHREYMHSSLLLEELHSKNSKTWELESKSYRDQFVLVRGFPTFVKDSTIKEMLWDYEIDYNHTEPVLCLKKDKVAKIGVWLIKFANRFDSQRFVRNYNGKHFNGEDRFPKVYASVLQ